MKQILDAHEFANAVPDMTPDEDEITAAEEAYLRCIAEHKSTTTRPTDDQETIKRRRKRHMQDERNYTRSILGDLIHRCNGNCELCGLFLLYILEPHHIKALAKGGSTYDENIAMLCPNCHSIVHKCHTKRAENPRFSDWIEDTFGKDFMSKLMNMAYGESA